MTRATAARPTVERLTHYLFDRSPGDPLAEELTGWLVGSPRFRIYAEAHRDKIRKKVRSAADAEALRDVRAELQGARLLLADPRIDLAFEAYGAGKRGPDLTVTYRGRQTFNLEITRRRRLPDGSGAAGPLLAKLQQLPPSVPNALLVAIEGTTADTLDVAAATRALRSRADAKDEAFFVDRGFEGTRDFYERYLRLGAVFVVVRHEIDYLRPALRADELEARTWISSVMAAKCLRSTELVRKRDQQLVARGVTTWGFVAFETGRPKRISEDVRAAFEPYVHS